MKIGFIGAGNMGYAMLKGALTVFDSDKMTYTDVNKERLEEVKLETKVNYCIDNTTCVQQSDIVVLAVKPQYLDDVLRGINSLNLENKIFISIAPGITITSLKEHLGEQVKVIRAMPNTPALVNEGVTAIAYSQDNYTAEEKNTVQQFFESFGEYVELDEKQLDMVVPVSGSSPAYVYMFIEAMADAGVLFGLPRKIAYKLAAQSVLGAAKMVLETGEHPGTLKDAVCSPGGTTIESVKSLEKNSFRGTIIEAMIENYNKVQSLK